MFAKVFEQIFDSSIAEDWQTRVVFEDMLILADQNGVVDKTCEAIARRTNVPIEIVKKGIKKLEAPDPQSRNPKHEGRRIARLDEHREWGWLIVNYEEYRKLHLKNRGEKRRLKELENIEINIRITQCNASLRNVNDSLMLLYILLPSGIKKGVQGGSRKRKKLFAEKVDMNKFTMPKVSDAEVFCYLPTSDGDYPVSKSQIKEWENLFPNCNVAETIKAEMVAKLKVKPTPAQEALSWCVNQIIMWNAKG